MQFWIIAVLAVFLLQFVLLRGLMHFKPLGRISLRQFFEQKTSVKNSTQEFASENPHMSDTTRDYGEYSMDNTTPDNEMHTDMSPEGTSMNQGSSASYLGEGRIPSAIQDIPAMAIQRPSAHAPQPLFDLSSFSKEDWKRAVVLRVVLGPPGGRMRE